MGTSQALFPYYRITEKRITLFDFILKLLSCIPIALQLSGALVLISAMKSIDQVIKGVISPSDHAIGTFSTDKKKILINVQKVKSALANHYYQKFAMHYILWGYLGAVLFNASAPNGIEDMCLVAAFSIIFLLIAVLMVKWLSARNAPKHASYDSDKVPDGTVVVEYE